MPEGDVGTATASFTVTLSPASGRTVTVDYATADGTATAPDDYQAVATTTLTFDPGETSKAVTVTVNGDADEEPHETFTVNLSAASNASVADAQGVGTIFDDDAPGLDFYTVTPCRIIDTRLPAGTGPPFGGPALSPGQPRVFALAGHCGISPSARAISVNVTATQAGAAGFVRLYPANQTVPQVSALNYSPGVTRGNNAIVGLSPIGELAIVSQQGTGTVHLILDVNGYFE